jgi:23S rRNA pseudouridine1911/1915/1917 synthase
LLIDILQKRFPDMKKSGLLQLLSQERVSYNDIVVTNPKKEITKESLLEVAPRAQFLRKNVKVLFSDDYLVVVEKPSDLLSVETDTSYRRSLHSVLKDEYHPSVIYVVHRLDREVSGVMVFAKNQKTFQALKKQLEERTLKRQYGALVAGKIEIKSGTWESYLVEDDYLNVKSRSSGELARTHFTLLQAGKKASLLKIDLDTGRKHQIRVHCQESGHPIIGDKRYGGPYCDRLMLHSVGLTFVHPATGKTMSFFRPLPEVFSAWLDK